MKKLASKRMELLYGFSGFGPNFLMLIIGAYIIDAFSTAGFDKNIEQWTIANKTIVYMAVFSVLVTIAKVIDGVIDVPLASLTDNLRSKWGRRRPTIAIGLIPLTISYFLICLPFSHQENSMFNTIFIPLMLIVFYCSYTMCLVTYYGTFSEITMDTDSRIRLSNFKTFFDTVSYALGYAVIPLMVSFMNIQTIALIFSPLMLTMLIPLFVIKEPSNIPADSKDGTVSVADKTVVEEKVPMWESIKTTFKNKAFVMWVAVFGIFFFGLQMFLAGQNVLASGPMGLEGWKIAIINTAAFAPVPLMLWIYRKVMKKWGFRVAFQSAILSFAVAMGAFVVANVDWIPSVYARLGIAAGGSTIGSYGIGAFFSAPYIIPSQIAAEEHERTGKTNSAMYFAVQGLFNAVFGAISTGVVWLNIKGIEKEGFTSFGTWLMPIIVSAVCLIAFVAAFFMPAYFNNIGKKIAVNAAEDKSAGDDEDNSETEEAE